MSDVIVIGGGAAGMMAAVQSADRGLSVTLLEPNHRMGKKLRITGKGRCNVTNNCSVQDMLSMIRPEPRFFKGALYAFSPADVMAFFENNGVGLKTERGNRVFPVSDRADDIADTLERLCREKDVSLRHDRALSVLTEDGRVTGVRTDRAVLRSRAVILCTGGMSYPATGSTGDGYRMAEELGHTVTALRPSLVPMECEDFCRELQGLSLRNVTLSLYQGDKLLFRELGEMLFTHFGVSGPLVLSASACLPEDLRECRLEIDFKPGLDSEKLDERLLRDFNEFKNRDFLHALDALLPQKLIPVMVMRSGIPPRTKVNAITRQQRGRLLSLLKSFPIRICGLRPIDEAIVTAGGVSLREINSRTMESKLVSGLYFAGEVMDLDACTGGYNLQIAWSTACAAARAIPTEEKS